MIMKSDSLKILSLLHTEDFKIVSGDPTYPLSKLTSGCNNSKMSVASEFTERHQDIHSLHSFMSCNHIIYNIKFHTL